MFLLVTLTSDRSSSSLICFAQEQHKNSNKHAQTDIRLTAFFQDDLGKPVPQKGWANLDFDEARGDGVAVASAGKCQPVLHEMNEVKTSSYATWFTAGGAIHIAHYDVTDDVITRKL